jgi:hypothetical protein
MAYLEVDDDDDDDEWAIVTHIYSIRSELIIRATLFVQCSYPKDVAA